MSLITSPCAPASNILPVAALLGLVGQSTSREGGENLCQVPCLVEEPLNSWRPFEAFAPNVFFTFYVPSKPPLFTSRDLCTYHATSIVAVDDDVGWRFHPPLFLSLLLAR